jgi:DNA polymerase-1
MKNKYFSILDSLKENEAVNTDINDRVLVIDGLNTFIRSWSVSPATNDDGIHVGGITGSLMSIGYAIKNIRPTRVIICFDGKGGSSRRRKVFPAYKGNRKPTQKLNRAYQAGSLSDQQENMKMQLGRLVNYLDTLPVSCMSIENIEADDAIAYITQQVLPESRHFIMSSDKDFLQLVDDRIGVWSPTKKKMYFKDDILDEYGISAPNYLMYRVLSGDKSDNIPGIPGVGLKSLLKRVPELSEEQKVTIDELIKLSADSKIKMLNAINENYELLELNHKLMQLQDVDISGGAKEKIRNIVHNPIPSLNKPKFQLMMVEDKMNTAIKNHEFWLKEVFMPLHAFSLV